MKFGLVLQNNSTIVVRHNGQVLPIRAHQQGQPPAAVTGSLTRGEWVVDDGAGVRELDVTLSTIGIAYYRNFGGHIISGTGTVLLINPKNPPQPPAIPPPAWMVPLI